MSDRVTMSREDYYQLLKMVALIAEPVRVDNRDAFALVQETACAVHAKLIKLGDEQLIPRVNRIVDEERRKGERRSREDDAFVVQQHREYLQQVREEKG